MTFTYVRDAAGRVTSRTRSDGSSIARTFGAGDHTATLTDASGLTGYEYDAAGRWTGLVAPSGATWSRTHDVPDRVTSVSVEASATSPARTTTYEHDEGGNITRIVDPLGAITEQTYTRSPSGEPTRIDRKDGSYVLYDYDSSLRLTGEHYRDPGGAILTNIRYVYDADGNRTQRIVQEGPGAPSVVEDCAYSAGDLLETVSVEGVTTADYDYDTAGRVTSISDGATCTLGWDADDHVTSITEGPRTVHWTFDGDGRRVSRTEEAFGLIDREVGYAIAPTLSESLESPHAVTDGSGNEQAGYVFAGEHPLFRYDPVTGEPTYYLQDGMGSVIGLVGDDLETEVSTILYDAFGNELGSTGTLATLPAASAGDFRFQGMWLDEGTGLYYVRARVYEPETGRFLSRDPAEGRRAGPETYRAYVFAGSAPTIARDPTGSTTLVELGSVNIGFRTLLTTTVSTPGLAALSALRALQFLGIGLAAATLAPDELFGPWSVEMVAQGNVIDTGIRAEMDELISTAVAQGLPPPNRCDVLRALMEQASRTGDRERMERIKRTQKGFGCRRSRAGR